MILEPSEMAEREKEFLYALDDFQRARAILFQAVKEGTVVPSLKLVNVLRAERQSAEFYFLSINEKVPRK